MLRRMTNRCPDLLRTLARIRKRVCILSDLVRQYIYDPDFRGNFTLQTVCASLLPATSTKQVPNPGRHRSPYAFRGTDARRGHRYRRQPQKADPELQQLHAGPVQAPRAAAGDGPRVHAIALEDHET